MRVAAIPGLPRRLANLSNHRRVSMGTLILKVAVADMCEMYELFYRCQATEFFQIFCSGLPYSGVSTSAGDFSKIMDSKIIFLRGCSGVPMSAGFGFRSTMHMRSDFAPSGSYPNNHRTIYLRFFTP
jgi:hypothetical protein